MNRFTLVRLPTLADARARVADDPEHRVFRAGGIDLIDRMKEGLDAPDQLVELGAISDEHGQRMRGIDKADSGGWSVGTLVTLAQVAEFEDLPAEYRALQQAASAAASPGIRNAATVGGNLLQRPRCWYYRHSDLVCLKKGGDACFAVTGRNELHAIFAGGPSYIVHPSSLAAALVALDAKVSIVGDGDPRSIPIADLFQHPKVDPTKEHTLAAGEVLVGIDLPSPLPGQRSSYATAKERQSQDWPLAEAAVRVGLEGGVIKGARVGLGHVAPVPWRSAEAEKVLEGQKPSTELFAKAAEAATGPAQPLTHNAYKVPLVQGLLRQALHEATQVPLPE